MAKGAYSVIVYPDSVPCIRAPCDAITDMGGHWAYIFHDLETHLGKKPHFHLMCGWENHYPNWETFKRFCNEYGLVAISSSECTVRFPTRIYQYLSHETCPEKVQYKKEWIFTSPYFDAPSYETAYDRRIRISEEKKTSNDAIFMDIMELCALQGFIEFSQLCDFCRVNLPDFLPFILKNSYPIKGYIDSKRFSIYNTEKR